MVNSRLTNQSTSDAEYDAVDESSDEVRSTTIKRKVGMGQKGGRHSPFEGEWTRLVGEGKHA